VNRKHGQKRGEALHVAAAEENVLVQVNNLSTHPCVAAGLAAGEVHVYGWYYDIASGVIRQFDQSQGRFVDLENSALATSPLPIREW
jgi:carbonic anhydrase